MGVLGSVLGILTGIWGALTAALGVILSWLAASLFSAGGLLLSSLGAVLLASGLFTAAVVLNLAGTDDVYVTLTTTLFSDETAPDTRPDPVASDPALPEVDAEAITDSEGQFSKSAFVSVTGLSPSEFIHLFVRCHGGRVRQATLNRCLPWSASTAVRYLDELEQQERITRVPVSGEHVVCTPEKVPDDAAS